MKNTASMVETNVQPTVGISENFFKKMIMLDY